MVVLGGMTKAAGKVRDDRPRVRLRTTALNRIVEFSPGDLTITVEAGMTLRALDETLSPHGLRLPLDPPDYDGRATIGGVLAFGDSGPIRLGYGGPREHVIGMSMVQGDGTLIRAGGRVVKNVAGYDLHRLFVGSHGSLGMIATASFKLRPRPEARRLVTVVCGAPDDAERITAALLAGDTRPVLLDWIRPVPRDWPGATARRDLSGASGAVLLAVGYEDCIEAAEWQSREAVRLVGGATAHDEAASQSLYSRLRARMIGGGAAFRISIASSRVHELFAAMPVETALHAHAASGVVHGSIEDRAAQRTEELLESTSDALDGALLMRRRDGSLSARRRGDGVARKLEQRTRGALDPAGVFPEPPFAS